MTAIFLAVIFLKSFKFVKADFFNLRKVSFIVKLFFNAGREVVDAFCVVCRPLDKVKFALLGCYAVKSYNSVMFNKEF